MPRDQVLFEKIEKKNSYNRDFHELDLLFKPRSIAVIGASNKVGSVGLALMENLLKGGFPGDIYPINLRTQEIVNIKAFPSVQEVQANIDLAVIATPARTVLAVLQDCAAVGIRAAVIITAGFKEVGAEGKRMFIEIQKFASSQGIRVIGPNCVGLVNPHLGLNASFLSRNAIAGRVAMISQSGALCASILDWAFDQSVGFSHFVSIGSMMDVDFGDLINYFGQDENTDCILIYMESLTDADKFLAAAKRFTQHKPIVVLKAGKSAAGAKAALSHTGSLAGNDAVYNTAFQRAGIIRVKTMEKLFDCAQGLAMQKLPAGDRLSIVTNAGGPGVLAVDSLMQQGGELAQLTPATFDKLNQLLPDYWSHSNPVDVLGSATIDEFKKALEACLEDEQTDAVLAIFTTQGITDPVAAAEEVAKLGAKANKPLFACWMGEQDVQAGRELLEQASIPNFRYPERAVYVFLKMAHYAENLEFLKNEKTAALPQTIFDKAAAKIILDKAKVVGRRQLLESEAKQLLGIYHIPTVEGKLCRQVAEAGATAEALGFPVVMKIVSPQIGHKTEVGGVVLNINSRKAVENEFVAMMARVQAAQPQAKIEGIWLEKMISKKFELLIGAKRDPVFGPVVVFGLGGIMVELLKDTNMELAPINQTLALRLMQGTKAYQLINGFRGLPKVDLTELGNVLINFSQLLLDFPEIEEVDMNPFVADDLGGMALDAYIVIKGHLQ